MDYLLGPWVDNACVLAIVVESLPIGHAFSSAEEAPVWVEVLVFDVCVNER